MQELLHVRYGRVPRPAGVVRQDLPDREVPAAPQEVQERGIQDKIRTANPGQHDVRHVHRGRRAVAAGVLGNHPTATGRRVLHPDKTPGKNHAVAAERLVRRLRERKPEHHDREPGHVRRQMARVRVRSREAQGHLLRAASRSNRHRARTLVRPARTRAGRRRELRHAASVPVRMDNVVVKTVPRLAGELQLVRVRHEIRV